MTNVNNRITIPDLYSFKNYKQISSVAVYDFTFAQIFDRAGIDVLLVGDSLGMLVQGENNTLPVTLEQMIYHCRCVSRGVRHAVVVGDMPFMSYQVSMEEAVRNAGRLVKEGGVDAVKLEGGVCVVDIVEKLVKFDIPVFGHVGLTPQSYLRMGGHKIQGIDKKEKKGISTRKQVFDDALALDASGVCAIVLEGIPGDLASEITKKVSVPTIGIAAGDNCDGQVLVGYDLLGLTQGIIPPFVKKYGNLGEEAVECVKKYIEDITNLGRK